MDKWYQQNGENSDVVISSRVRLARNLERYPFAAKISDEQAKQLVNEVGELFQGYQASETEFYNSDLSQMSHAEKMAMMERHILSPLMVGKKQTTGLILSKNESATIMVNEEDHVKIQVLTGGMNLEQAFVEANELDDMACEKLGFAFDEKFGYLTSCPTNLGTGLRASYMVFLPALGGANKINRLSDEIGKYGVSLRGIYGEGTNGLANIYQIANQNTLGSSEVDIMNNLDNIVVQVIKQERKRREFLLSNNYDEIQDQVYRSYGVLKYTRQINSKDAMTLLAQVKFGIDTKLIEFQNAFSIYDMMMAIQPYNIQLRNGKSIVGKDRDKLRAEYINQNLPELKK